MDMGEHPVRGARVALFKGTPFSKYGDTLYDLVLRVVPPHTPLQRVVTDEEGAFQFSHPGLGGYTVLTEAEGFARDVVERIELTENDPGGHLRVCLEAGTELAGRIVDPDGRAIAGGVVLIRSEATPADPEVEVCTVSDAAGRFRYPSLPAGREWGILARAEHWTGSAITGAKLPQKNLDLILERGLEYRFKVMKAGLLEPLRARVLVREGEVPLEAGETDAGGIFRFRGRPSSRVTIHIQPERYLPILVESLLPAEGGDLDTVYLGVGSPLPGVVVDVVSAMGLPGSWVSLDRRDHAGILPVQWVEVGPHGRFEFPGYDGRGGMITAILDGYVSSTASDGVNVQGWPVSDVRVPLARGGAIEGWISGPTGAGAGEVSVRLILPGGIAEGSVATRKDGSFTLKGVPFHQPMRVLATKEGLGYAVSGTQRLTHLAATGHVTLQLTGQTSLRGHVLDGLGGGLCGARILVETAEKEALIVAREWTDSRGFFKIDGLVPGPVRIVASLAGRMSASIRTQAVGDVFPEIQLTLQEARTITGTAYIPGNRVAPGVVVHARPLEAGAPAGWGFTDVDGRFQIAGIGAGWHMLKAVAPGGATASQRVLAGTEQVALILASSRAPRSPSSGDQNGRR